MEFVDNIPDAQYVKNLKYIKLVKIVVVQSLVNSTRSSEYTQLFMKSKLSNGLTTRLDLGLHTMLL
jgi:hypothetical protein